MSYNNSVLIGNWNEERLKNQYDLMLFLRKRERHELLLQKSRTLFSNLLKERPLAISGTYVLFGFNVQIVATDISGKGQAGGQPSYGLALSSLVMERQVDYTQNICEGCLMTLSPITTPCCRNTFVILSSSDESLRGVKVNYGEEFVLKAENYGDPQCQTWEHKEDYATSEYQYVINTYIFAKCQDSCVDPAWGGTVTLPVILSAPPLYVRYTPEVAPSSADRMPIQLSSIRDSCCRWTTMPLLPRNRLEGLGSPIKTSTKLVIKNCVADKNLSVMNQNWMQTFFGPECGVTCRNYVDVHKRCTAENIFSLVSDVETKTK